MGEGHPPPTPPVFFRRLLGFPNRFKGPIPTPKNAGYHKFSGFSHFVKQNEKSPGSKNVRDTFPVISVTSTLYQLPYRAKKPLGGKNHDFLHKIIGSLLAPKKGPGGRTPRKPWMRSTGASRGPWDPGSHARFHSWETGALLGSEALLGNPRNPQNPESNGFPRGARPWEVWKSCSAPKGTQGIHRYGSV